ncbi:ABC transporter permease [Reinekea thalattae]|uniref:ABC transporter permease n=2 Tax=Reinekea thalattae TaxID=2593301 RepID=A0A5C8ZDD5_9GAMM|nr:ABC transporter permease [Reinekea thalattae]
MIRIRNLEFILGISLTLLLAGLVFLSPWLFADKADSINLLARLSPPLANAQYPLGTDALGRDILARIAAGGKVSFIVGIYSSLGAVILGAVLGLYAGYYGGWLDTFVMRFADIQLAFPFILFAMTIIAIYGPSLERIIFVMIATQWVQYARIIRGSVLALRERTFILAAKSYGQSSINIIFKHILPNAMGPLIILLTLNIANNILLESSLTFLGLGVDPQTPSWGGMLAEGRNYIQTAWWITLFPGLAIMLTVLGLNLLGDWLRDQLGKSV